MRGGPCLCGDLCCHSCGPAQGNWRCPICGEWASEGCIHFDDDKIKPEYALLAAQIAAAEREAEDAMVKEFQESEKLAEEYWKSESCK